MTKISALTDGAALQPTDDIPVARGGFNRRVRAPDASTVVSTAVATHVALSDPHVQYQQEAEKGAANGYASLDAGTKVPAAQLPASAIGGGVVYQAAWNATTNTPTLVAGTGTPGFQYKVSVAGTQNLGNGSTAFAVGDYVIYNGATWDKFDQTDLITSVFTRTGAIVAAGGDYTADQITETGTNKIMTATERTKLAGVATAAIAGVTVLDEGIALATPATAIDFTGAGVVVSGTGVTKSVSIPGSGGSLTVQDEGAPLATAASVLNFAGTGVVASGTGGTKTITIAGAAGGFGNEWINLKTNHGAVGDGVTNDSAAWQAAINASRASRIGYASIPNAIYWTEQQIPIFIPPGRYNIPTGATVSDGNLLLFAIPNTVVLIIGAGQYAVTFNSLVTNCHVEGISFAGGKGGVQFTYTAVNVQGNFTFKDCHFDNYTECAVGNNAPDMPNWTFDNCIFYGSANSIGVAIGGYNDISRFIGCKFYYNRYHLKIGDRLGGSIYIQHCDFIMFGTGVRQADIWFVPNVTDAIGGINSGIQTLIHDCKFGNENIDLTVPRILFAMEGPGANRQVRHHSVTPTAATGINFISGISFRRNRVMCGGGVTAPFIRSYVHSVKNFEYIDNYHTGGSYSYLIEFDAGAIAANDGIPNMDMRYHYRAGFTEQELMPFANGLSNCRRFLGEDESGLQQGFDEVAIPGVGDGGLIVLGYSPGVTGGTALQATLAQADVNDSSTGAEVTFTAAGGSFHIVMGVLPVIGRYTWAEFTVAQGATLPLLNCRVEFRNYTNGFVTFSMPITLTAAPKTYRIPFIMPNNVSNGTWILVMDSSNYAAGVRTKVKVSNFAVYHSKAPVPMMNRLASGNYIAERIPAAPASSTAPGRAGQMFASATALYFCTASNVWVRWTAGGTISTTF